jgi:transposase
MSNQLTHTEIDQRLTKLRNLEMLHEKAKKRIERLLKENNNLKDKNRKLEEILKSVLESNEKLSLRVEELATKVFGKKQTKKEYAYKQALVSKRTIDSYHRPIPTREEVTKQERHSIKKCPCGNDFSKKRLKEYYVEDIVLQTKEVIHHTVEQWYCTRCRKWQSKEPLPSAKVVIGETAQTFVCYASTILRLSYKQIQTHIEDSYQLYLSDGEITKILHRRSLHHQEDYDLVLKKIQSQDVVHMDETGDRVRDGDGYKAHTWLIQAARNPEVVFAMGKNRGIGIARALLGKSHATGVTDDYGTYTNLFVNHQLCFAHLHRKLRDLATSKVLKEEISKHCQSVFEAESVIYTTVRTIANRDDLSDRQRILWCTKIRAQLTELAIPHKLDPKKLKMYKETLTKNIEQYLTCIRLPNVPADNNQAERSIRPVVLKRKISFGHITTKGADSMSILMSIFMTVKNRIAGTRENFFSAYDIMD